MRLAVCERLLIERLLDVIEERRNGRVEVLELDDRLFAGVAANEDALTLGDVARADFQTQRVCFPCMAEN